MFASSSLLLHVPEPLWNNNTRILLYTYMNSFLSVWACMVRAVNIVLYCILYNACIPRHFIRVHPDKTWILLHPYLLLQLYLQAWSWLMNVFIFVTRTCSVVYNYTIIVNNILSVCEYPCMVVHTQILKTTTSLYCHVFPVVKWVWFWELKWWASQHTWNLGCICVTYLHYTMLEF